MSSILALKFFDIIFKLSIMKKLSDGININEAFECLYKEMSKKSEGKKIEPTLVVKDKKKCC